MYRQTGFSLLEVLVAVLILAFGLLGLAGLQTTSVRSNHSAYLRTQATLLAYDLADQMRAMRKAVENGDYDDSSAEDERSAWDGSVTRALGAGATGTVVRNGGFVTITIAWDDNRGRIRQSGAANEVNQTFVYETEL